MSLQQIIQANCTRAGNVKLKDLMQLLRHHGLDWTRSRTIGELLKMGFQVGEIDRITFVAPLSINAVTYAVRDGHLVQIPAMSTR